MAIVDEAQEAPKSNKMKKSELKEMIRAAFLNEATIEETQDSEVFAMVEMIMDALGAEKFVDELILAMDTDEAKANLEHIIRMHDLGSGMDDREDMPGFEGTYDALDNLKIREADEEEVEDIEVDTEEEIEDVDVDVDADVEDAGEVDVEDDAKVELTGDKKDVSDNLEAALEAARALGDEKLVDQIGNTITFFTRAHIVKEEKEEVNESFNRMQRLAGLIK